MATMQDIADRVGVHRVTVSNVLNQRLSMRRPDAARRAAEIRRVAHELGYRPNAAAKATRTGRTGIIGMIRSPRLSHSVHASAFDAGLDEALHARGLCLLRDIIDDPAGPKPAEAPRIVREDAVDGLLVNYAIGTPPAVRDLIDRCRIPTVWINRKRDENCVHPADEGVAREATRYLIEHGHRDIIFVDQADRADEDDQPLDLHYSVADRRLGYFGVMSHAGLKPRHHRIPRRAAGVYRPGRELEDFCRLLSRPDRPSAVLIGGGGGGRTLVAAAWKLGLRVPEDLSIITFDNDAHADREIAVDRVLVPYAPMGRCAVDEVCALIEAPDTPRPPVVVPFEFHRVGTVARRDAERSA